jgi:hypothetical protein
VALSDDGRYLAYASGGESHAWLVLRDVREHATVGTWRLKGGYESLGYSENRFWLVREEDEGSGPHQPWPKPRPVHSVLYELKVGKAPRRLFVRSEPGMSGGSSQVLSVDGRYYHGRAADAAGAAAGRGLGRARRAAAGVRAVPAAPPQGLAAGLPRPAREMVLVGGPGGRHPDLRPAHPWRRPDGGASTGRAGGLRVGGRTRSDQLAGELAPARRRGRSGSNSGRTNPGVAGASFSPDSRYLMWPNRDGTLTVVDCGGGGRVREFESGAAGGKWKKVAEPRARRPQPCLEEDTHRAERGRNCLRATGRW